MLCHVKETAPPGRCAHSKPTRSPPLSLIIAVMALPCADDDGPFISGYNTLQSDLLTLGKSGAAAELAAFVKKHNISSVDASLSHAFGHFEDRCVRARSVIAPSCCRRMSQAAAFCRVLQQRPPRSSPRRGLPVQHGSSHSMTGASVCLTADDSELNFCCN